MKYWLFDGNDVVGPFAPTELAQRTDFSASSMLAPENRSEKQEDWQVAISFPDFKFDELSGKLEGVTAPEPVSQPAGETAPAPALEQEDFAAPSAAPVLMPEPALPRQTAGEINPSKTIPLAKPISLVKADEDILPLAQQELASEQASPLSPAQTPALDTAALDTPAAAIPALNTPVDCTDLGQPAAASSLPSIDQAPAEDSSVTVVSWHEPEAETQQPAETAEATAAETAALSSPVANASLPEEISIRQSLKPHLQSTPEIDAFLHQQQTACRGREKSKWLLWGLLLLFLPGLVALAMYLSPRKPAPSSAPEVVSEVKKSAQTAVAQGRQKGAVGQKESVPQKETALAAEPKKTLPAAEASKPPTPGERAVEIVKNYKLSENRGTISAYLSKRYQTQLASGHQAQWSAEPLHKSVYIVKYRLTKTRTEPIVYVFQADVSKEKLIGALNNISLDLVGKI